MEPCQCSGPGHCPVFNRPMGVRLHQICSGNCPPDARPVPPEVTVAYRRKWAAESGLPKKAAVAPAVAPPPLATHRSIRPPLAPYQYVTTAAMIQDAVALAGHVPSDVDAVVGIARSGLLPATAIAAVLHLPMLSLGSSGEPAALGSGGRMKGQTATNPRHLLLVDDTIGTGKSMRSAEARVQASYPGAKITRLAVYVHPQALHQVDLLAALYPGKHYLEWNWQNAGHGMACGYDFDGILCQECPAKDDDDGPRYKNFLMTARPLFLPRRGVVPVIVTARHEKYRAETEDWLARHGVRFKRLVMRTWNYPVDRRERVGAVGRWKAEEFAKSRVKVVAESELAQATVINTITGLPVICPAAMKVLPPKTAAQAVSATDGPGSRLRTSLVAQGVNPGGCSCSGRMRQMNDEGAAWCQENRPQLLRWLRVEHERRGWDKAITEAGLEKLLDQAISG